MWGTQWNDYPSAQVSASRFGTEVRRLVLRAFTEECLGFLQRLRVKMVKADPFGVLTIDENGECRIFFLNIGLLKLIIKYT